MTDVNSHNPFEGPPPDATSDEIIARLVVDELYWDSRVDASKVQVVVTDGVVTLTGHTPTYADRYAADANATMKSTPHSNALKRGLSDAASNALGRSRRSG